jgi:hypothetical protein
MTIWDLVMIFVGIAFVGIMFLVIHTGRPASKLMSRYRDPPPPGAGVGAGNRLGATAIKTSPYPRAANPRTRPGGLHTDRSAVCRSIYGSLGGSRRATAVNGDLEIRLRGQWFSGLVDKALSRWAPAPGIQPPTTTAARLRSTDFIHDFERRPG